MGSHIRIEILNFEIRYSKGRMKLLVLRFQLSFYHGYFVNNFTNINQYCTAEDLYFSVRKGKVAQESKKAQYNISVACTLAR